MICGKQEIGEKPTIEQLTIRIWQKKLNVSSIKMFEHYENKKWKNKDEMPLKDIDPAIGRFNQFVYFKRKTGDLRKEYDILLKTNEWKEYAKTVHQHYHNECQRCHKKGNLEVHHMRYYFAKGDMNIPARLPWEYPLEEVLSLCHTCHEKEQHVQCYSEHERLSGFK